MKLRFILISFLLSLSLLYSQDYYVTFEMDSVGYLNQNNSLQLGGYVHNTITDTITVSMFRDQNLPTGWLTSLCFGNCLPPQFERIENVKIPPHDSLVYEISFVSPEISSEEAKAQLSFWDGTSYVQYWFTASTEPTFSASVQDTLAEINAGESVVFNGMLKNTCKRQRVYKMFDIEETLAYQWTLEAGFGYNVLAPNSREVVLAAGDSIDFYLKYITDNTSAGTSVTNISIADTFLNYIYSQKFEASILPPPFSISVADTSADTLAGQSHEFSGYVFNNSAKAFTAFLVREENNIPAGWSTTLCFGSCPTSDVDSVNSLINPGDSLEYKITFYSDATPADGDVLMQFYADGETDTLRQAFSLHTTSTAIGEQAGIPVHGFELLGNYPNPFNPTTAISYQLSAISRVELTVFDISGKTVQTLINERQEAGRHMVQFDASALSSGTYLYQLRANGQIKTGKMLLLK